MKDSSAVKVPVYAVIRDGNRVSKKRCVRLSARTVRQKETDFFK